VAEHGGTGDAGGGDGVAGTGGAWRLGGKHDAHVQRRWGDGVVLVVGDGVGGGHGRGPYFRYPYFSPRAQAQGIRGSRGVFCKRPCWAAPLFFLWALIFARAALRVWWSVGALERWLFVETCVEAVQWP
jgi:hypothetical protein